MSELLRYCTLILVLAGMLSTGLDERRSAAAPPARRSQSLLRLVGDSDPIEQAPANDTGNDEEGSPSADQLPEFSPMDEPMPPAPRDMAEALTDGPPDSLDAYAPNHAADGPPLEGSEDFFPCWRWLGLRHYTTHGRNAGMGVPLVGTSWLNRPYYAGIELGPMWISEAPQAHVSEDLDLLGGVYIGDDWDYYWGGELAAERATPELINSTQRAVDRGDRMWIWSASMLYYPWGDSLYRPYWRCGIGAMEIDWPTDDGHRRDEALWAFPIGVGIKYPFRRWLAVRAEFGDTIGIGNSGVATQHDLALSFAVEWRIGAHPRSYWPWNPSRHIW